MLRQWIYKKCKAYPTCEFALLTTFDLSKYETFFPHTVSNTIYFAYSQDKILV